MKFKRFITSAFFLKHLALAVIIMFLIILLTMISLRIYTHHGESLKVPDFVGLSLEQAKSLANENNLRFLVIDSIYTSAVPRGCVAEQNPPASFKVRKDVLFTCESMLFMPKRLLSQMCLMYRLYKPNLTSKLMV